MNSFLFFGLSGSGKSTIFNIISGLLIPDEGEIIIDGENYTGKTGRVSYMYQKRSVTTLEKNNRQCCLASCTKGRKEEKS